MYEEIFDVKTFDAETLDFSEKEVYKVSSVRNVGGIKDIVELSLQRHIESVGWINGFYAQYGTQPFIGRDGRLKTMHVPLVDYARGDFHNYIKINRTTREATPINSEIINAECTNPNNEYTLKVIKTEPHKLKHNTVERAVYEKILENERLREKDELETNLS